MRLGALEDTFRALKHKNFRYFWVGQCISLMGTWMQRTAQIWLVYSLTRSPVLLGLLGVFQSGPMLLLSLPAGVFIDRLPKRRILLVTQTIFMLQALTLAVLVWSGLVRYWHILLLATIFGLTQTLDNPTRQSFFIELVGKDDLMNAISLNSTIVNLAKIVGPSIAGVVMAGLGPAPCFFLNAVSYLAVLYGLLRITVEGLPAELSAREGTIMSQVREGLVHIWRSDVLRLTVAVMAIVSCFAMNSNVIIPVYADRVLHRGAREYGLLLSANGFGALCGALTMASRSKKGLNGVLLIGDVFFICSLQILVSLSRNLWLSALLIAAMGFANMAFNNMANSTLQLNSANAFRGRVMSVYALVHNGSTPFGNFFAGTVMEHMGAHMGFFMGGAVTLSLVLTLLLAEHKKVRQAFKLLPASAGSRQ